MVVHSIYFGYKFEQTFKTLFMQNAEVLKTSDSNSNFKTHNIFKDQTTFEKVHKHLSDINDEITDQDILNIKTEMTPATQVEFEKSARREGFSKEEINHTY